MDVRFVPNEVAPDLYRKYTISFPGGSLTASKDVLASIFERDNLPDTCSPEVIQVSCKESLRTRYPGDTEFKRVQPYTYTKKNYSNGSSSKNAAGEPIRFLINDDFWTARLNGSHQDFMDYLCANRSSLKDGFTLWKSQRGKTYLMTDNSEADQNG